MSLYSNKVSRPAGDSLTTWKAIMASGMCEIMETACRGMLDYTFLGGAQIDMYWNFNSTRVGTDHQKPKVRFPGSVGANDFASFCWRMMVMTPLDSKRFVEKVSYCLRDVIDPYRYVIGR